MKSSAMLKHIRVIVLALVCCPLLLPAPARSVDMRDAVDRAMGLLQSGEIEGAQAILTGVQADGCDDPLLTSAQGVTAMYAYNYSGAEAAFRRALQHDPQQLAALWGVSLCLLTRNRVHEASAFLERAAQVAPADTRIKTLQAYADLMLRRLPDAAAMGKIALDNGENSPLLPAILAQTYQRLGNIQKALEFGSFAAKSFDGMDFLAQDRRVCLPLTMEVADAPQGASTRASRRSLGQRTDVPLELPNANTPTPEKIFRLVSPTAGSTVFGPQHVRTVYSGTREIKFVIFLVDHVIRGLMTDFPYHFEWDADGAPPGEHQLCVRAFDYRGTLIGEDIATVTTSTEKPPAVAVTPDQTMELQLRLLALTMPDPQPLSLFANLGYWHACAHETEQSIVSFEKAAAIDPASDSILASLAQLYKENGLHSLSPAKQIFHGPLTGNKHIALTFDDGPNPLYTPSILSELKKYNAHATFFMVGKMVQLFPDLVLQVLADGHELANHSYTHPNLTKLKQRGNYRGGAAHARGHQRNHRQGNLSLPATRRGYRRSGHRSTARAGL